MAVWLNW